MGRTPPGARHARRETRRIELMEPLGRFQLQPKQYPIESPFAVKGAAPGHQIVEPAQHLRPGDRLIEVDERTPERRLDRTYGLVRAG